MDTTRSAVATFAHQLVAETCDLDGTTMPVPTELSYDSSDPYAVTISFRTDLGIVAWTFARELLLEGILEPAGDGDVHVWPCLDDGGQFVIVLELCTPVGDALVHLPPEDVTSFADRMLATVPVGEESARLDLDAVVAQLLAVSEDS
jgi:sporulation and cell division protein SsgA